MLVSWVDSHCENGWGDARDAQHDAGENGLVCESAGWLVQATDRYVLLAMSRSTEKDGQLAEVLQIPREAVRRLRALDPGRTLRQ